MAHADSYWHMPREAPQIMTALVGIIVYIAFFARCGLYAYFLDIYLTGSLPRLVVEYGSLEHQRARPSNPRSRVWTSYRLHVFGFKAAKDAGVMHDGFYDRKHASSGFFSTHISELRIQEWRQRGHGSPSDLLARCCVHGDSGVIIWSDLVPPPDGRNPLRRLEVLQSSPWHSHEHRLSRPE